MSDQLSPEQKEIEDWLVYFANNHVFRTDHERSMYAKVLAELARLREYEWLYKEPRL